MFALKPRARDERRLRREEKAVVVAILGKDENKVASVAARPTRFSAAQ